MKAAMRRFSVLLLILAVTSALLCSCQDKFVKNKDDVKLKTVMEEKDYIKKNLPAASYVKTEEEGDDKAVYIFMDKVCGFQFKVTSEKIEKEMEGASLGWVEKTTDNWERSYSDYIKDKAAEKAKAEGLTAETDFSKIGSTPLAVITDKSAEELTPVLKELAAYIKGEDKHGQFTDGEIWLCTAGAESDKMYDNAFAFYLFGKDETVDKAAREEYFKQNRTKTA